MSALVVERLVVGQSGFRAGPFAFEASPGELVALLGPNGGGKSTLLRTIAGLLAPVSGLIHRAEASGAAFLPAPGSLDAPFSAAHMVALGRAGQAGWSARLGRIDYAAAEAALARLGVERLAGTPFSRLSSGQQQLVLLARILVQEAGLCLLDEPTAMLDPAQGRKVARAIRALAAEGRVVLVATHDLDFAGECDLVISVGGDRASGKPREILTAERLAALYGAEPPASWGQSADATTRG